MENSFGKKLFFAVLVVLVPLLAAGYMIFAGMTVVFVENDGATDVALTVVNRSGRYIETSDIRTAPAGGFAYLILSPKMAGTAAAVCAPAAAVHTGTAEGGVPLALASAPQAFGGTSMAIGPISPDGFSAVRFRIAGCVRRLKKDAVTI